MKMFYKIFIIDVNSLMWWVKTDRWRGDAYITIYIYVTKLSESRY